jgi:hypothetical protein
MTGAHEFLDTMIPHTHNKFEEGILILRNENKLALIYKAANNEIYDFRNAAD